MAGAQAASGPAQAPGPGYAMGEDVEVNCDRTGGGTFGYQGICLENTPPLVKYPLVDDQISKGVIFGIRAECA